MWLAGARSWEIGHQGPDWLILQVNEGAQIAHNPLRASVSPSAYFNSIQVPPEQARNFYSWANVDAQGAQVLRETFEMFSIILIIT